MDQKSAERADEPSTVFPEWPPPTTVEIKPLPTSTFPTYPAIPSYFTNKKISP
jgi:hypothetical protein